MMTTFIAILVFFLLKYLYELWKERKERKEEVEEVQANKIKETENMEKENFGTKELFLETLTKMGCQYEVDEEYKERFHFNYKGEHFLVDVNNKTPYVFVWDTFWYSVELEDLDQVSRLRKVINDANMQYGTITVYTMDEEDDKMYVHCKSTFLFVSEISYLERYLQTELNTYFMIHQFVYTELAKLQAKEEVVRA